MSFNNLAFNVSKAQPTTSTTNATSTTTSSAGGSGGIKSPSPSHSMSPILQTMLAKSAPTLEAQMDSVEDTRRTSHDGSAVSGGLNRGGDSVNSELIGIFDRFDVRQDSSEGSPKTSPVHVEKGNEEQQVSEEPEGETETKLELELVEKAIETSTTGEETKGNQISNHDEQISESGKHEKEQLVLKLDHVELPEDTPDVDTETKEGNSINLIQELDEKVLSTSANSTPVGDEKWTSASMGAQAFEPPSFNEKSPMPKTNAELIDLESERVSPESSFAGDKFDELKDISDITDTSAQYQEGNEDLEPLGDETMPERKSSLTTDKDSTELDDNSIETADQTITTTTEQSIQSTPINHLLQLLYQQQQQHEQQQQNVNGHQLERSHHPFNFQNFLGHLKRKSANPIVRYIRSFLILFTRQGHTFTGAQKIKIVAEFKSFIHDKFNAYEPFASMNASDLENSREGLEKLVMNRIYEQCFPPEFQAKMGIDSQFMPQMFKDDLAADDAFSVQLEKFSWVNGVHLDIDMKLLNGSLDDNDGFSVKVLDQAATELNKINVYRAPRDKIICILNCCKIIFGFLKSLEQETNADEFVPLLIFVILKAKVSYLISNVHYIENFRGSEWLDRGETSYYLSSIEGAIHFIQDMSKENLTIDDKEYNAHMEAWDAEEKQRELIRQEIEEKRRKQQQQEREQAATDTTTASATTNATATGSNYSGQAQQPLVDMSTLESLPVPIPRAPMNNMESLSPSRVLFTSAEMLTKSITSFLSPLPEPIVQQAPLAAVPPPRGNSITAASGDNGDQVPPEEMQQIRTTYANLKEIFADMDKGVLKDLAYMKKGDLEACVDACLELINDV